MTATRSSESTYRSTYAGLWLLAGLGLGVLTSFGRPLVGVAVYAVAVVGTFAVSYRHAGPLFDERDASIHRQASGFTLQLYGWASAVVFPALTALYGLGYFEWDAWTTSAALLIAAIYATYGVATVAVSRRN